jgi:hypothetical protein
MENIVRPKKKALMILCICSSVFIRRRYHPSANDCSARLACFHVAGFFLAVFPQHAQRLTPLPEQPVRSSDSAAVKRREECPTGHCSAERFATAQ